MSKQMRSALIGLIAVAVLGGAILAVTSLLPQEESGTSQTSLPADAVVLLDRTQEDFESVAIKTKDEEFTVALDKTIGICVKGYEAFPRREESYAKLANAAVKVIARRMIDQQPENPAEFGFDPPAATVDIKLAGGQALSLEVGNLAPDGTGYYARVKGEQAIYLMETDMGRFLKGSLEYISLNIIAESAKGLNADIERIAVNGLEENQNAIFERNPNLAKAGDPTENATHLITSANAIPAGSSAFGKMITTISHLDADAVTLVNPTQDQLSLYGMDRPVNTIEIDYKGKECYVESNDSSSSQEPGSQDDSGPVVTHKHILKISAVKDGFYYVMVDDRQVVYQIRQETLSFVGLAYYEFAAKTPVSMSINTIESIRFVAQGMDKTFQIQLTQGDNPEIASVFCEGKVIEAAQFRNLYNSFLTLAYDSHADTPPAAGISKLKIQIKSNLPEGKTYTIEYLYDGQRGCFVTVDGKGEFIVLSKNVDQLIAAVQKLTQ